MYKKTLIRLSIYLPLSIILGLSFFYYLQTNFLQCLFFSFFSYVGFSLTFYYVYCKDFNKINLDFLVYIFSYNFIFLVNCCLIYYSLTINSSSVPLILLLNFVFFNFGGPKSQYLKAIYPFPIRSVTFNFFKKTLLPIFFVFIMLFFFTLFFVLLFLGSGYYVKLCLILTGTRGVPTFCFIIFSGFFFIALLFFKPLQLFFFFLKSRYKSLKKVFLVSTKPKQKLLSSWSNRKVLLLFRKQPEVKKNIFVLFLCALSSINFNPPLFLPVFLFSIRFDNGLSFSFYLVVVFAVTYLTTLPFMYTSFSVKYGKNFLRLAGWNSPGKVGEVCLKAGATWLALKGGKRLFEFANNSIDQVSETANHIVNTAGDTIRHNTTVAGENLKIKKK